MAQQLEICEMEPIFFQAKWFFRFPRKDNLEKEIQTLTSESSTQSTSLCPF